MKHCPHQECGHRTRTGQAAEYLDTITECAECGTPLVDGPAKGTQVAPNPLGATSRLLVTLAAMAAVVAAGRWQIELGEAIIRPFRLGLFPLLSAFIAVEILAVALPRWRPLRGNGRHRLKAVASWLTLPVALALAVAAAAPIGDWGHRLLAIATWVAAVFALGVVADLVSRFGLGNGYAVLIASAALPAAHDLGTAAARVPGGGQVLLAVVILGSVVAATLLVLRTHERGGPRLPTCGIVPLDAAALLFALPATLQTPAFAEQSLNAHVGLLAAGGTTAAVALALGHAFTRRAADEPNTVALATLRSVLFILAAFAAGGLLSTIRLPLPSVYLVIVVTAVALDLIREWRMRAEARVWIPVSVLVRVTEIEPAVRALREANIPAFARGAAFRSLLQFFGPFVPLEIWVPRTDASRAHDAVARICTDTELQ